MVKADTQENSNESQSENQTQETSEENNKASDIDGKEWMIRSCDLYKYEYKDCRSFLGRFYQYYIDGRNHVCQQWKDDWENCKKWTKYRDEEAFDKLIESETNRRLIRWKKHFNNDVWEPRPKPPEDWNEPLPEWFNKRYEGTYLAVKQKELNEGIDDYSDTYIPRCVIM